jgi:hypothetical protein
MEKDFPSQQTLKAGRSSYILIHGKTYFRRDKEGRLILIKGIIRWKKITIVNMYISNVGSLNKHYWTYKHRLQHNNSGKPHYSNTTNREVHPNKITIKKLQIKWHYRPNGFHRHLQNISFSSYIIHILLRNPWNFFQNRFLSDYDGIKLEINSKRHYRKYSNTQRLNDTLLNNHQRNRGEKGNYKVPRL